MKAYQKTQKQWEEEYEKGFHTPKDLYDAGFRPRSKRYRLVVAEWSYNNIHYSVSLVLSLSDYEELRLWCISAGRYMDEIRLTCAILEEVCINCEEECPQAGGLYNNIEKAKNNRN